ncbi:MAG: 4'-phosphopantetheinyl transferase superfamily protein [Candidatus Eremiobacteraeota bacterium]|nr:4'-phosphopantetheinyl transferase superfamily protein [Candidatus Eremiobacteraeota bacterium]
MDTSGPGDAPGRVHPPRLLAGLLPIGVVSVESRKVGNAALLYPQEAQNCRYFGQDRIGEYAAGRLCARRGLRKFGILGFPLLISSDRNPLWPPGIVGSISHTAGFCGVAVARRGGFAGVGIDAEVVGRVTPNTWPRLFLSTEEGWLRSLSGLQLGRSATIMFSAKEAFYKCQWPVTAISLDFRDVSVEMEPAIEAGPGTFRIRPQSAVCRSMFGNRALRGSYHIDGQLAVTGIALRNR